MYDFLVWLVSYLGKAGKIFNSAISFFFEKKKKAALCRQMPYEQVLKILKWSLLKNACRAGCAGMSECVVFAHHEWGSGVSEASEAFEFIVFGLLQCDRIRNQKASVQVPPKSRKVPPRVLDTKMVRSGITSRLAACYLLCKYSS